MNQAVEWWVFLVAAVLVFGFMLASERTPANQSLAEPQTKPSGPESATAAVEDPEETAVAAVIAAIIHRTRTPSA